MSVSLAARILLSSLWISFKSTEAIQQLLSSLHSLSKADHSSSLPPLKGSEEIFIFIFWWVGDKCGPAKQCQCRQTSVQTSAWGSTGWDSIKAEGYWFFVKICHLRCCHPQAEQVEQREGPVGGLSAQMASLVVFLVADLCGEHVECFCGPAAKRFREAQDQAAQGGYVVVRLQM